MDALIGKHFLTKNKEGEVDCGGIVVSLVPPIGALVRYVNWMSGQLDSKMELLSAYDIEDMKAIWFDSFEQVNEYLEKHERELEVKDQKAVENAKGLIMMKISEGRIDKLGFSLRDIVRNQWSGLSESDVVDQALASLLSEKRLTKEHRQTGGRPSIVWKKA